MNKKLTITLSTIVVLALVAGAGYTFGLFDRFLPVQEETVEIEETVVEEETPTAPVEEETVIEEETPVVIEKTFAELAAEAYPDAEPTESYTKEYVQQALYTASSYLSSVMEDRYMLSGEWAADNYDVKYLEDNVFIYLSEAQQQVLTDAINILKDKNKSYEERNQAQIYVIMENINAIELTDELTGSVFSYKNSNCSVDVNDCFTTGPNYSDIVYYEVESGELFVQTNIAFSLDFIKNNDNVEATIERTYDYWMFLTPNPNRLTDSQPLFIINSTDNNFANIVTMR
jgi:hypothetical protein